MRRGCVAKRAPSQISYSWLMLAMRASAFVAMMLLMSAWRVLVDFDGSLAGGGEGGSAGAVALDELAAQLTFGLVHNAPGLGIRHAHALGGAVERVLAGNTLQQQDAAVAEHARQILVARLNDQLCRCLVLHVLHVSPLKCLLGKRKACVKPSCALPKSCIVAVKVR